MSRDPNGLGELYRRHGRALLERARLLGNRADAEDLVQDVFVRALQARSCLRPQSNIAGWLSTILTRLTIDRWRKQRRWKDVPLTGREPAAVEPGPDPWWRSLDVEEVLEEVGRLPARLSVPLEEHGVRGRSYAEIAQHQMIPLATVGTRIHRARARIRKTFAPDSDPKDPGW